MAAKIKKSADTAAKRGYSIRIYLPDGTADGLKIVEKSNWSGRGVVCPRALFAESKSRAELIATALDHAGGETADLLRKHGGKTGEELKAQGK